MRLLLTLALSCLLCLGVYAQNTNLSQGLLFDGEPFLIVNPKDDQHLVVAWMSFVLGQRIILKTRTSFDGGQSWSDPASLPHFGENYQSADPSMAFHPDGNLYICYVDYVQAPAEGAVYVLKSEDGGLTWGDPSAAIEHDAEPDKLPVDRPWMVIDQTPGPHSGKIYITTKPAPWILPSNRPYFVQSEDGGASWSLFRYVDTTDFLVGPFIQAPMASPMVSADGTLHMIYPSWMLSQNLLPGFYLATSIDGGATLMHTDVIFSADVGGDSLAKGGYYLTGNPIDPDHLTFAYINKVFGDLDIFLLETKDGGHSWTQPLRINDDPQGNGIMQDLVWADFNDNGDLAMCWRDRRNAGEAGYETGHEVWCAVKWQDSTGFSKNFRVSDTLAQYHEVLAEAGNDFMSLQFTGDTVAAVWGDVRTGKLEIWFSKTDARSLVSSTKFKLADENVGLIEVFPNPVNDILNVRLDDPPGNCLFRLYDLKSNSMLTESRILKGNATISVNALDIKPGIYFLAVLNNGRVIGTRKVLIY